MKHSVDLRRQRPGLPRRPRHARSAHPRRRPVPDGRSPATAGSSSAGSRTLAARYPHLIAEVRGRGYMLGIRFGVDRDLWPDSLLGMAAEQGFFTPIFASYLLNVEGVRVAPTLNGNSVIRIEPPLTFRRSDCETLLAALERALEAFSQGETGRILKAILAGHAPCSLALDRGPRSRGPRSSRCGARRASPSCSIRSTIANYTDFDPSLAVPRPQDLARVARDFSTLIDPFVFSSARVTSRTGRTIYGEFISLPWTAAQMAAMPRQQAAAEVRAAPGAGAVARCAARRTRGLHVGGHPRRPRRRARGCPGHDGQLLHRRRLGAGGRPGHEGLGPGIRVPHRCRDRRRDRGDRPGDGPAARRGCRPPRPHRQPRPCPRCDAPPPAGGRRRRLPAPRRARHREGPALRRPDPSAADSLPPTGGCPEPDAPADHFLALAERLERSGASCC